MDLIEHYNKLYKDSIQKIESDEYSIDNLIDSSLDKRLGITLLVRPNDIIKRNIRGFINDLRQIDPEQYYQPDSDMHVTVMSLISCYNGFYLKNICVPDYIDLIEKSIKSEGSIEINFKGVTVSPSCIMIQGFLCDNTLNNIRDNLRINFKNSDLQQSIDLRYAIQAAHSTVVRFRKRLTQKDDYLKIIENYRDYDFGTLSTDTIELVYNDWYQRKEFVKELHKFKIKTNS